MFPAPALAGEHQTKTKMVNLRGFVVQRCFQFERRIIANTTLSFLTIIASKFLIMDFF